MNSCQCHPGFRAYRAPGYGCYKATSNVQAYPNQYNNISQSSMYHQTDTATNNGTSVSLHCHDDRNMELVGSACQCKTNYVKPDGHDFCVAHYIFNIHGRLYIQGSGITKSYFNGWGTSEDTIFNDGIKDAFGITDTQVYTYRASNFDDTDWYQGGTGASAGTADSFQTSYRETGGHDRTTDTLFEKIRDGSITTANNGMVVSFVIHDVAPASSVTAGDTMHEFISRMKSANVRANDNWSMGNTRMTALQTTYNTNKATLFGGNTVDALEVYLWALTVSYEKPVPEQPFAWAPTKTGTKTIPTFPTYAPVTAPTARIQRMQVDLKVGFLCWGDYNGTNIDHHDMQEFSQGTLGVTNRAILEDALETMLNQFGTETGSTDVVDVHNWHPQNYAVQQFQHYNPLWWNNSISVEVRVRNYHGNVTNLDNLMAYLRLATFDQTLATALASLTGATFDKECIVPPKDVANGITHSQITWTPPTRSPTRAVERASLAHMLPGQRLNCQGASNSGVAIEMRGRMEFISATDMDANLADADTAIETIYDKMAARTNFILNDSSTAALPSRVAGCNYVTQTWSQHKHVINASLLLDTHMDHADGCPDLHHECANYIITVDYTLAIPTKNMHEGNKVFHDYEFQTEVQKTAINTELSSSMENTNGWTASQYMNWRPQVPMVKDLKVFSLELAYIKQTVTTAPTPRPTRGTVDCVVSDLSKWTTCSESCGTGSRKRFRIVETENQGNGDSCETVVAALVTAGNAGWSETDNTCNPQVCPQDCVLQGWTAWGTCNTGATNHNGEACGSGTHTRTNTITSQAADTGASCFDVAKFSHPEMYASYGLNCSDGVTCYEEKACSEQQCPRDCTVTSWTTWTDCNKECGNGTKTRYRAIDTPAYFGGLQGNCSALTEEESCNEQYCPQDCVVSEWSAWGSCDKSCSGEPVGKRLFGAKQIRTRYVLTPAESGGHKCPSLTQSKLCALHPCGAQVCKSASGATFPLTCTYENGIVYTHHVNDVHDNDYFMCYHNYVTEVCTCLCWPKTDVVSGHNYTHACSDGARQVGVHAMADECAAEPAI